MHDLGDRAAAQECGAASSRELAAARRRGVIGAVLKGREIVPQHESAERSAREGVRWHGSAALQARESVLRTRACGGTRARR